MKRLEMLAVAVTVVALLSGQLCAQIAPPQKPQYIYKWSQPVDVDNGWDVYSFWSGGPGPVVTAADDWKCPDGRPVSSFHWWGSYIDGQPGDVTAFEISIHGNIPAGQELGHPSHPGALLQNFIVPVGGPGGVIETFYQATETHNIYQYNWEVPSPDNYFYQVQGQIYWLDIIGISQNATWGWHTALRPGPDNGLDAAVNIYDYNPSTGQYSELGALFDGQGPVQLAFELNTVPEPASMALVGSAFLVVTGLAYRRKMKS